MEIISIVVPCFNCELLIQRCLESIINQNCNFSIEVIIVDDGSTDESPYIIKSLIKKHSQNSKFSFNYVQQANKGQASARNKGINLSTGKYISFLDADDYWEKNFLQETSSFLDKHPDVVAVSTMQTHKIIGKPAFIIPDLKYTRKEKVIPIVLDSFFAFWDENNHVCTGSVLMVTKIVKLVGGMRDDFFITEDLEFWGYLACFGQWGFIPMPLFVSDGGAVTKKTGWLEKNKKRWASAPLIEEWEKRISSRIKEAQLFGYKKIPKWLVKNLIYSMILSERESIALQQLNKYRALMPYDLLGIILKLSSHSASFFYYVCYLLQRREYNRKLN